MEAPLLRNNIGATSNGKSTVEEVHVSDGNQSEPVTVPPADQGPAGHEAELSAIESLEERQMLNTHWYAARPDEEKVLIKILTSANGLYSTEAGLIALSVFCCKSLDRILPLKVVDSVSHSNSKDWIYFEQGSPDLRKAGHGSTTMFSVLGFPKQLTRWLRALHQGHNESTIETLLPESEVSWEVRSYGWLAKELSCSLERAKLISRDLLIREVYGKTANSVNVNFLRSESIPERTGRTALSHYLYFDEDGVNAFNGALQKYFGTSSRQHVCFNPHRKQSLRLDEVESIAKALYQRIDWNASPLERHNHLVIFVLYVAIAATGHRRSAAPFPFPWDWDLESAMAFLADKLITGSEARFVPISRQLKNLIALYASHLHDLSKCQSASDDVRNYARLISLLLTSGKEGSSIKNAPVGEVIFGTFFRVKPDGSKAKRIPTRVLDYVIKRATGISNATKKLRTSLATYLSASKHSGRSIQNYLGHQPEIHAHGAGSTWSVLGWADTLRSSLETYVEHFIRNTKVPEVSDTFKHASTTIPSLYTSSLGYEGRKREKDQAIRRAATTVRREIGRVLQSKGKEPITVEDFNRLELALEGSLFNDRLALDAAKTELHAQLKALDKQRHEFEAGVIKYIANKEPGPIEIGFSRSLRISQVFHRKWEYEVGSCIAARTFNTLERLAHLAISMVCFDAQLDPRRIEALVNAAVSQEHQAVEGRINLRAQVITELHDFEHSVYLGHISSGLVLGLEQPVSDQAITWEQVNKQIAQILQRLLRLDVKKWDLDLLCKIYRPYWLQRLPGSLYAVAIGNYCGPAADDASELELFGIRASVSEKTRKESPKLKKAGGKSAALKELKRVFSICRGRIENGEQRKQVQRKKLREELNSAGVIELSRFAEETQIVDLLLSFIEKLLDAGGARIKNLAFGSLEKYFGLVAGALIDKAWDVDFTSVNANDLTDLFSRLSKQINDKDGDYVLRLFNQHLSDVENTPDCGPIWSHSRAPKRHRAHLVNPFQVRNAIDALAKYKTDLCFQASHLIAIGSSYGLRRKEIYSLETANIFIDGKVGLAIKRNKIADLKSPAARRYISDSLYLGREKDLVKKGILQAESSQKKSEYLYADPTGQDYINSVNSMFSLASMALREACGNSTIRFHDLRHTYATIFGIALFTLPDHLLSSSVVKDMIGEEYGSRIKNILRNPKDWPFGLDALAVIMGHANVDSLLNTYFHGAGIVTSDYCAKWQPQGKMIDERLANVLGIERSVASRLRKQACAQDSIDEAEWRKAIKLRIKKFERQRIARLEAQTTNVEGMVSSVSAHSVSRAILHRYQNEQSLEGMATYLADVFDLKAALAKSVVEAYRDLVNTTGLCDFEHSKSELAFPSSLVTKSLDRHAHQREVFVSQVQVLLCSSNEAAKNIGSVLQIWFDTVNPDAPLLVCRNQDQLDVTLNVLADVFNADPSQIQISLHGPKDDEWIEKCRLKYVDAELSHRRASRGSPRQIVREVAIRVLPKTESKLPVERDFHRALVALYVFHKVWGMKSDSNPNLLH